MTDVILRHYEDEAMPHPQGSHQGIRLREIPFALPLLCSGKEKK